MLGLTLALLSCRAAPDSSKVPPGHSAPEVPAWTAYTGTFTYTVSGAGAEEPGCALVFEFEGVPADIRCDDCEYSFELNMTYDKEASVNTWRCIDDTAEADFTWTLGFDADFYGYDIGAMWKYAAAGSYWFQAFYADWEGDQLSFGYDYTSSSTYYEYYLYSFYGVGELSE